MNAGEPFHGADAASLTQAILDTAVDAIITIDETGRMLSWNRGAERIFGYRADDVLGRNVTMLMPEPYRSEHDGYIARYLSTGEARIIGIGREVSGQRRDGSVFPMHLGVSEVERGGGRRIFAGIATDLSARHAAEARVAATEERFRLLVDGVRDYAIVLLEADGTIASWNQGAEHITGYPAAEAIGRHLSMLYVDDDVDVGLPEQKLRRAVDEGTCEDVSWRERKDGTSYLVHSVTTALTDPDGTLRGFAKVARDITAQHEAEEQRAVMDAHLRQAQRLEAVGRLAGGVAHDFNNLLAVILMRAEALAQLAPPGPIVEGLGEIGRTAERAAALTRQLLLFSRDEPVELRPVDVNSVVRDVQLLLRRTIGEDVELDIRLASDVPPVLADPGQLEQVLMNLAVNARDAMPRGGRLSIETRLVDVDSSGLGPRTSLGHGRYLGLMVTDTGTGMTREVASRAFEPFYTTKEVGKGTGLGLSTVYGIITKMGGDVLLYSEPGFGTTVRALLPPAELPDAAEAPPPPTPARRARGGSVVLVVEDEPDLRDTIELVLRTNRYDVLAVGDATQALEVVERGEHVDIVVTDVVMPGMAGTELVDRLRARRPSLPVVFMSGYSGGALEAHGVSAVDALVLNKPFRADDLLTAVARAVATSAGAPPS